MEDLPIEVQVIHGHLVLPPPAGGRDPLVLQYLAQGAHVPRRLVAVVAAALSVKDTKEVVVRSSDDLSGNELRDVGTYPGEKCVYMEVESVKGLPVGHHTIVR